MSRHPGIHPLGDISKEGAGRWAIGWVKSALFGPIFVQTGHAAADAPIAQIQSEAVKQRRSHSAFQCIR